MSASDKAPTAILTPIERANYRLASFFSGPLKPFGALYNRFASVVIVGACAGRRIHLEGVEHLEGLGPGSRVVWVANHRSFFDFFVVFYLLFIRTSVGSRIFFPVRSNFFYDRPFGPLVNFAMASFAMFPPILRDKTRSEWNRYAMTRCREELDKPGTHVGIHPEGTRGTGPDPFQLKAPKIGVGQLATETREPVQIRPIFIVGPGNSVFQELRKNLFDPTNHPIYVQFGPAIDFADLRERAGTEAVSQAAAERCMAVIAGLGAQVRSRMQADELAADPGGAR